MSALLAPIPTTPSEAKTRADFSLASELKLELMFVGGQVASLTRKRADVLTMDVFVAENLETIERALFIVESRQTAIIKLLTEARGQHRGHQPQDSIPLARSPSSSDDSGDDDVPLAALMASGDASDVKFSDDKIEEPQALPAAPSEGVLTHPQDATLHKHKYDKAKEALELLAHGGMRMYGRNGCGAPTDTRSGFKYSFRCCHAAITKCPASGCINSDYTISVGATHLAPTKNAEGASIAGTGCVRYSKVQGPA